MVTAQSRVNLVSRLSSTSKAIPYSTSPPVSTSTPSPSKTAAEIATITPTELPSETTEPLQLGLTGPAFGSGSIIPEKNAREGEDLSPPLEWSDHPQGTVSFTILVVSDPMSNGGAGWIQWALVNIPAAARSLPEGLIPDEKGRLPDGSQHLQNSWQELRCGGPSSNRFETRKFTLHIFALDTILDVEILLVQNEDGAWIGSSEAKLTKLIEGHILAQGTMFGKYKGS